jgi:hypothetical protein
VTLLKPHFLARSHVREKLEVIPPTNVVSERKKERDRERNGEPAWLGRRVMIK